MLYIITFLFGSLIGSFLNVCIYRIPRVHLTLTEQSFTALRGEFFQDNMQHTGIRAFIARCNAYICKHLLPICHFWGLASELSEEPLPSEILTKLEGLKDKDYVAIAHSGYQFASLRNMRINVWVARSLKNENLIKILLD